MASPGFIYAFDQLGPSRFVELCGLLLGARYKGFVLSAPGPDGGIDAESYGRTGEWRPETRAALENTILKPNERAVFQFKHKVVARVGQAAARKQLQAEYRSTSRKPSELHARLIQQKPPALYTLVTNVEVNSEFRAKFVSLCQNECEGIPQYQIVGLDDLESWVTMERSLRHHYFPTLFGPPRFELQIELELGHAFTPGARSLSISEGTPFLNVAVLNVGTSASFVDMIKFKNVCEGRVKYAFQPPLAPGSIDPLANPKFGDALHPGRRQNYRFALEFLRTMRTGKEDVFFDEVLVRDEIGNWYRASVDDSIRNAIFAADRKHAE